MFLRNPTMLRTEAGSGIRWQPLHLNDCSILLAACAQASERAARFLVKSVTATLACILHYGATHLMMTSFLRFGFIRKAPGSKRSSPWALRSQKDRAWPLPEQDGDVALLLHDCLLRWWGQRLQSVIRSCQPPLLFCLLC